MKTIKLLHLSTLVVLGTCASALPSSADVLSAPVINPANNHLYYLLAPTTWTASQAEAISLGGNLVTINDAAENAWIYDTFGELDRPLWIGLTDQAVEGSFCWISGESLSYSNWCSGQPDNGGGFVPDEDYVYMVESNTAWPAQLTPEEWNDVPNDGTGVQRPVYGVVEVVPEPSTVALGVLGLCIWLRARHPRRE